MFRRRDKDLPPPGHGETGSPKTLLVFVALLVATALALSLVAGLVGLVAYQIEES